MKTKQKSNSAEEILKVIAKYGCSNAKHYITYGKSYKDVDGGSFNLIDCPLLDIAKRFCGVCKDGAEVRDRKVKQAAKDKLEEIKKLKYLENLK